MSPRLATHAPTSHFAQRGPGTLFCHAHALGTRSSSSSGTAERSVWRFSQMRLLGQTRAQEEEEEEEEEEELDRCDSFIIYLIAAATFLSPRFSLYSPQCRGPVGAPFSPAHHHAPKHPKHLY
uniref:Uncharacterized protein n=1 Tax=Knipowitschia caucasica TaxID=637954 RepID=A0AAV2L1L8_KNICA